MIFQIPRLRSLKSNINHARAEKRSVSLVGLLLAPGLVGSLGRTDGCAVHGFRGWGRGSNVRLVAGCRLREEKKGCHTVRDHHPGVKLFIRSLAFAYWESHC